MLITIYLTSTFAKSSYSYRINQSLPIDQSRALDVILRHWATEEKTLAETCRAIGKAKQRREGKGKQRAKRKAKREQSKIARDQSDLLLHTDLRNPSITNDKSQGARTRGATESQTNGEFLPVGSAFEGSVDIPQPSLTPQLSGAPYAMYQNPRISIIKMGRTNADVLVGIPSMTQRNYSAPVTEKINMRTIKFRKRSYLNHFSINIKGFALDKINYFW